MNCDTRQDREEWLERHFAHESINRWGELSAYQRSKWVYRGQRCSDWPLRSTLDRLVKRLGINGESVCDLERNLLREFRRVYYRYAQHIPLDTMEWLANMQHHGTPTRLLDFSHSIYVASYFAIEASHSEAAVWALNADWLLDQSIRQLEGAGHTDARRLNEKFDESHSELIERWLFRDHMAHCAVPLNSFRLNERLAVQRGVFLCQGDPQVDFEKNLMALDGHDASENALRIRIPVTLKEAGLADLFNMNITRSSLFPGLDGFAESLGVYHPFYAEFQ